MYSVKVKFQRFDDVRLGENLRGTGVYVIWSSKASVKPSYIGKGDILARLSKHDGKFAFPVRGYVGIVGSSGQKREDKDAKIIEALLLEVARDTERWPSHNGKSGHIALVQRTFQRKGPVRITVKEYDPFAPPTASRYLHEPKNIWFVQDIDGNDVVKHHWNKRKKSTR